MIIFHEIKVADFYKPSDAMMSSRRAKHLFDTIKHIGLSCRLVLLPQDRIVVDADIPDLWNYRTGSFTPILLADEIVYRDVVEQCDVVIKDRNPVVTPYFRFHSNRHQVIDGRVLRIFH